MLFQETLDNFEPYIEGDFLYGRGTADMKAGVAAMMQAFYELSKEPENLAQKNPITYCYG